MAYNYRMPLRWTGPMRPLRKIEDVLSKTPGVKYTTGVVGFSLLSVVQNTYSAFFFVTLEPWSERTKPEEQYEAIKMRLNEGAGRFY